MGSSSSPPFNFFSVSLYPKQPTLSPPPSILFHLDWANMSWERDTCLSVTHSGGEIGGASEKQDRRVPRALPPHTKALLSHSQRKEHAGWAKTHTTTGAHVIQSRVLNDAAAFLRGYANSRVPSVRSLSLVLSVL